MTRPAPRLTIGEVSERTGLSAHALRFYEREGLLPMAVQRDPSGRRQYSEEDLGWLEICLRLRSSGMPLAAIRAYADLVRGGDGNEEERLTLLREHEDRVRAQLRELRECLAVIRGKADAYEDHLASQRVVPGRTARVDRPRRTPADVSAASA